MGIQLEFYVILLIWLSMLGSPQITGGIIGNSFFQVFIILPGVLAGIIALFSHVVRKNFLNSVKWEWEDACHFLSLMIFFVGFYCAVKNRRRRGMEKQKRMSRRNSKVILLKIINSL